MYYLQSRYYDPQLARFINADDAVIVQAPLGNAIYANLYPYCNNNPINLQDDIGYITPANVIGAIVGAGAGALIGLAIANYFRLTGWKKRLVIAGSAALVAVAGWFAGPAIYEAIKPALQNAVEAGRLAISKISAEIAKLLRLVDPKTVKFARAASKHQSQPARRVPLTHLVNAIKNGTAKADASGSKAIMYTIKNFWKNGKQYNLEVLYDWATKTIYHFKYWR